MSAGSEPRAPRINREVITTRAALIRRSPLPYFWARSAVSAVRLDRTPSMSREDDDGGDRPLRFIRRCTVNSASDTSGGSTSRVKFSF